MPLCSDPSGLEAAERALLATRPLFVVHGTQDPTDNDFATLEAFIGSFASEGTAFHEFQYARGDQEDDLFPRDVLSQRHVFARMQAYGHDVWTATYGRLDGAPKTVSYEWLLAQSLDGSEFLDPRDPSYDEVMAERRRQARAAEPDGGCATAPQSSRRDWPACVGLALLALGSRRRRAARAERP
jgi:hypothetical protein